MKITKHLAILLAMGSMTAFAGAQAMKAHKMTGVISDSKCGAANHKAACVKKCIDAGAKPVFVGADKKVWSIDDPDSVADYYGDKVKVTATVDATNNSIHINKVKKAQSSMSSM